jgi:hypothetical protein
MAMSYDEKLARFVKETRERVDRAAPAVPFGGQWPNCRLGVILRRCGWSKQGSRNLNLIKLALGDAGIFKHPDLETSNLDTRERVYFLNELRDGVLPPGWTFSYERDLEEFLHKQWASLTAVLPALEIVGRQHRLPSGRVIDLVGWRARAKELVVIEVKKDKPPRDLFSQIHQYLYELDSLIGGGISVRERRPGQLLMPEKLRGIGISGRGSEAVRRELAGFRSHSKWPIEWYRYVLEPRLERIEIGADLISASSGRFDSTTPAPVAARVCQDGLDARALGR